MVGLFRAAQFGLVPTVHPTGTLSMLHGADCAHAVPSGGRGRRGHGVLYVAEPEPYNRRHMAELVGQAVGRRVRVIAVPPLMLRGVGRAVGLWGRIRGRAVMLSRDKVADMIAPHQSCDPSRAAERLGWEATRRFETGARETYLECRRRGWLG